MSLSLPMVLGLAAVLSAGPARSDLIETRLVLDGRDVSKEFAATVSVTPLSFVGNPGRLTNCVPGLPCEIREGTYVLRVKAEKLVEADRPALLVEKGRQAGLRTIKVPVTRAGRLEIAEGTLAVESVLDVVSVETGLVFQQRVTAESRSMTVPAGTLIVGLRDPNLRHLGLLRMSLKPDAAIPLPPPPVIGRGRGQVFAEFVFEGTGAEGPPEHLACRLSVASRNAAPDVGVLSDGVKFLTFWFDVPAGDGEITTDSHSWTPTAKVHVGIPERGVGTRQEIVLVPTPTLSITFRSSRPPPVDVEMELLDCARGADRVGPPNLALCETKGLQRGTAGAEIRFPHLQPSAYVLRWKSGTFGGILPVDLRDAKSASRTIEERPIAVEGSVRRGTEGVRGRLEFRQRVSGVIAAVETDSDGTYRAQVSEPGSYMVDIQSEAFPSYRIELIVRGDVESVHRDFQVPANAFNVHVTDARGGKPIAGASVSLWLSEVGSGRMLDWAEDVLADENGWASVPPVGPGMLSVTVSAEGYRESPKIEERVDDKTPGRTIDVRLHKRAGQRLRILQASGAPAVGAEVAYGGGTVSVTTGPDGAFVTDEPLTDGQPLVVFTAEGQIAAVRYMGSGREDLTLPASGSTFLVMFRRPDGSPLVLQHAEVALDGIAVPMHLGRELRAGWDTGSKRDGTLRIAGLPTSGELTIWPFGRRELSVVRILPVEGTIEFTIPPKS
ncbi:MAG: carboxypeptidase-like regulatory domain-containing protein [Acidobacteriota bacterium]